jgi:ribonuclease R
LDGRKIDFRLINEGEALLAVTNRAMKDKTGGHTGELPAKERGVSRDGKGNRRGGVAPNRPSRGSGASGLASSSRTERGSGGLLPSPIQALKAAVKKAAGKTSKAGRKQGKKPRR